MNRFITVGGISIISLVMGIFVFIFWQVLPLFQNASVEEVKVVAVPAAPHRLLGVDEYAELPFLVDAQANVTFVDLAGERGTFTVESPLPDQTITAVKYVQARQQLVYGTADGQFCPVHVAYSPTFEGGERIQQATLEPGPLTRIGKAGYPIQKIDYGDSETSKLVAAFQEVNGEIELHAATLVQERTLFGAGEVSVDQQFDLTSLLEGRPEHLLVSQSADRIYVATESGELFCLMRDSGGFAVTQRLQPFGDLTDPRIATMDFLLGDVSLVLGHAGGANRLFSLSLDPESQRRVLRMTKEFPPLGGTPQYYALSLRNKAFLIGHGPRVSLRYGTTARVRWAEQLPYPVTAACINGKYSRIVLLDTESRLHLLDLDDPHPEAGFRAMFGKIWYEGSSGPKYAWQSTGGSDQFEPKLSLIPLIFGTIKGTIYAMLFAVPIALLAAVYCSQFAHPTFRAAVKPTMEIMASLPSVVLGFLAALWLAPILDTRVPSILLIVVVLPLAALGFGYFWSSLPIRWRRWIPPGYEFLAFAPVFLLAAYVCWELGPVLERHLFVVRDPETGTTVADFRLWWPEVTGADFQQRNSLVVGFVMGFAVIPIIFTISEDSLSNVPLALRSGSLALGASRWQTALGVVLPTASAGIFSALMIGLGRAVGETMIVVMATGNTPIMDMNIFSGMRTLSANIAVELPEAPVHGTLYRTLFLGALVLFVMTFILNTLAEILRQRLRERYKLT